MKNITEFKFEIGITNITYYAQDVFQNNAKCLFHVTVEGILCNIIKCLLVDFFLTDKEPPVIENCENPPVFLTSDPSGANITWDEPNIFDNSQKFKVCNF